MPVRGVDPGFASRPAALEKSDVVVRSVQRKVNGAAVYQLPKRGNPGSSLILEQIQVSDLNTFLLTLL